MFNLIVKAWILSLILIAPAKASVIYVDKEATGASDGSSWTNAYVHLSFALIVANPGDEIWVAAGIYKPLTDTLDNPNPADPRTKTFAMKDGVKVYGGFVGSETSLSQRNWLINKCILSGNIGLPNDDTDNCYNVVMCEGIDAASALNGFFVQDGYTIVYQGEGGGIRIKDSSIKIKNIFLENNSSRLGGAIFCYNSDIVFENLFCYNKEANAGYGYGGGIFVQASNVKVINSIFVANSVHSSGSAIATWSSSSTDSLFVVNCTFTENNNATHYSYFSNPPKTYFFNSIIWDDVFLVGNVQEVDHCTVKNGFLSGTNIYNSYPSFQDPANLNFALDNCSSAVNVGWNAYVNGVNKDFFGQDRIFQGTVDLGAYELQESYVLPTKVNVFVDSTAMGSNNGLSWADALEEVYFLDSIINHPPPCTLVDTVFIAQGSYKVALTAQGSFSLDHDVVIMGGFPNGGGTLNQQNTDLYPTVFTGELGNPNLDIDNVGNLLKFSGLSENTVIDGISFTHSFLEAQNFWDGFNIDLVNSSPVFKNCHFSNLYSNTDIVSISGNPVFYNCHFLDNRGVNLIRTNEGDSVQYINCAILNNKMYSSLHYSTNPFLISKYYNCVIVKNNTQYVFYNDGFIVLQNVTQQNTTYYALSGNGSYTIVNSILWDFCIGEMLNEPDVLSHSIIKLSADSPFLLNASNIYLDPPLFVNSENNNYRLLNCSDGINNGMNSLYSGPPIDFAGNPRIYNSFIDIGAYERQVSGMANPIHVNKYVDKMANGINNGTDWMNAYEDLQEGLDKCYSPNECVIIDTIFVAEGDYHPEGIDMVKSWHFFMPKCKAMVGGFPNGGSSWPDRNAKLYPTIISGERGTNNTSSEHSPATLIFSELDSILVDGFVITNNADSTINSFYNIYIGAAANLFHSNATFSNVIFTENNGYEYSSIFVYDPMLQHETILNHCVVTKDTTRNLNSISANIMNFGKLKIFNSILKNNVTNNGSIVRNDYGILEMDACLIANNNASSASLALLSKSWISNCVFGYNNGTTAGGIAVSTFYDTISVSNCSFYKNTASTGYKSVFCNILSTSAYVLFANNIYDNGFSVFHVEGTNGFPQLSSSLLPQVPGITGSFISLGGMIYGQPPQFIDTTSIVGFDEIFGTFDDGLHIKPNSIARNNGSNIYITNSNFDASQFARIVGGTSDIGAYESPCGVSDNIYVHDLAPGNHSGESWFDGIQYLSRALRSRDYSYCATDSIFVAEGIYFATDNDDPNETILLPSGAKLFGGYEVSQGVFFERDTINHQSVFSANIGSTSATTDNTFRIFTVDSISSNTTLDGIKITTGRDSIGSAIYHGNSGMSDKFLVLNNILISDHISTSPIYNASNIFINNCQIVNNKNVHGRGVGILNEEGMCYLRNSTIDNPSTNGQNSLPLVNRQSGLVWILGNVLLKQ